MTSQGIFSALPLPPAIMKNHNAVQSFCADAEKIKIIVVILSMRNAHAGILPYYDGDEPEKTLLGIH